MQLLLLLYARLRLRPLLLFYCVHIIFPLFKLIRLICIFWSYRRCVFCFFTALTLTAFFFVCLESHLRVTYEILVVWLVVFSFSLRYICDSTETRICHYKTVDLCVWVLWLRNRIRLGRFYFWIRWLFSFLPYLNTFSLVSRLRNTLAYSLHFQHLFQDYFICILTYENEIETNGLQSTALLHLIAEWEEKKRNFKLKANTA